MQPILLRLALASALLAGAAPLSAPAAGPAITHTQFIDAYFDCNNTAWAEKSRMLIFTIKEPTPSDKMRGITSAKVRGFAGEGLYFDGVYGNVLPRAQATVGWALATKTFADRGQIEARFRSRDAALAYLRPWKLNGIETLGPQEIGAIATELELSSRSAGRFAITRIAPGTRLGVPLDAAAARSMLAKIGSHFDVGTARTLPQAGRACPAKVLGGLFRRT